jgi:hypothetical protein
MAAGKLNITIEQGSTFQRNIVLKDGSGDRFNLTGYQVRSTMRPSFDSSDNISFDITVTSASSGEFSWNMSAAKTRSINVSRSSTWVYDIEIEQSSIVTRVLQGSVSISREVTK